MKKKIIVLGSTGSIGKNTLKIIKTKKHDFTIQLLSTNKNINKIINQAKEFKVKNIIISDLKKYTEAKKKFNNIGIKIYNCFDDIHQILKKNNVY